jgi:hypothetical protein
MDDMPMWRRITRKLSSWLGITSKGTPSRSERVALMSQSLELTYLTALECGYMVQITLTPLEALVSTALSSTNTLSADPHYGEPSSGLH